MRENIIEVRPITNRDSAAISSLSNELGHSIEKEVIKQQVKQIVDDDSHFAFVAVMNKKVVGYVHGFISIRLTSAPFLEIGALVVDPNYRKSGIGSLLIQYIESQAGNASKIRVRCNQVRSETHHFYYQLGFTEFKEQKVFEKENKRA